MKLNTRDAVGLIQRPDPTKTGLLIYGADAMRVATKRQDYLSALLGANAEEEMRLARMNGAELRKDSAMLNDAIKAQGFFPGPRAAFVEDATDAVAATVIAALADWQTGDAQIVVTAGQLKATSKLRKAFETHSNAYALGIYDDPPSQAEIEATLSKAGIANPSRDAMNDLTALARELDPGDFRQTVEKIALYKMGDTSPLSSADIDACAPTSTEADLDDVLNIVAEGRAAEIGPMMRKLQSQGLNPVTLCISSTRHFRTLHAACSDLSGPASGIGRVRPPVFGPRRDRMLRQAQGWGLHRLEHALTVLTDTDLQLRSADKAPQMALVERMLIRLAMIGKR